MINNPDKQRRDSQIIQKIHKNKKYLTILLIYRLRWDGRAIDGRHTKVCLGHFSRFDLPTTFSLIVYSACLHDSCLHSTNIFCGI